MSEVKVNKLSPRSGTTVTLGDSGDTISIPSGVTFDASSGGLAGTLTTAAQPNITSVGTLTSFTSTGIDDNATSTAITIDSSERVGIGTASPDRELTVGGVSNARIGILSNDNVVGASQLQFGDTDNSQIGRIMYEHDGNKMTFWTNNSERMRIDSSGNVGIGTSTPAEKFHVVDTGSSQAAKIHSDTNNSGVLGMSILAGLDTASSSGDCKWVRLADGNDSGKAYIQFKSSSPNAEFVAISDERLKTNIQDTDVVGLDVINNLRLVKFDWNETATQDAGWSMTGHQKLGFVAQEVEQILPEFISEDTKGFKIMGDSGFVPYLIKAMQEQQTKIQELEARITALETQP